MQQTASLAASLAASLGRPPRPSRAAEAHRVLRAAIVNGSILPRMRLRESVLAAAMGFSRTPIREALRRLEQEGLAERRDGAGLFVAELTGQGATEIIAIRSLLEGYAARLAAERVTEVELDAIRQAHADAGRAIADGDLDKLLDANARFHDGIKSASHSDRCVSMISELRDWILRFRVQALGETAARQRTYQQHEQILAALEQGNGPLAEEVTRTHIDDSMKGVIERLLND